MKEIQHQLEKTWVMGFQDLRVADTIEDDIYALTFPSRPDETTNMFTTRLGQMLSRLQSRFVLISSYVEFNDTPFAVVEFKLKDELK